MISFKNNFIGVFDSGVGGLKILSSLKKSFPNENFVYVFDRSHAPYGNRSNRFVNNRAYKISSLLYKKGAKVIIVACNTATTVSINDLREKIDVPFIGVEPPIKSACENTNEKILMLCTSLTAKQKKVKELLLKHDINKQVTVVPCEDLAFLIESNLHDLTKVKPYLETILSIYKDIKHIILGCTHYYFIKDLIKQITNENITFYEATDGVSNRLSKILNKKHLYNENKGGFVKYIYL